MESASCRAKAYGLPSVVVVTLAVLSYFAQLVEVVAAVTCTVSSAPAARLIGWPFSSSSWLPALPVSSNDAKLPFETSISQVTGVPALPPGSLSLSLTPVAVPVPEFLIVTVKPIADPADTLAASAVFSTSTLPHSTSSEAEASGLPSLVVVTLAVLSYFAQLVEVVAAVTCTVSSAPAARLIGWPFSSSSWLPALPVSSNDAKLPFETSISQVT